MSRSSKVKQWTALVLMVFGSSPVLAADLSLPPVAPPPSPPQYNFWTSPTLLGDWNGLRPYLSSRGFDFQLGYVSETVSNWTGGDRRLTDNAGQFQLGTTVDLAKVMSIPGGTFQMTIVERNGRNLAADAGLGTLQLVNEVYGRGDIVRLTQFWYDQKFFNNLLDVKVGRVTVAEDFFAFSCDFVNLTFCGGAPGNIVGNYIFNWPVSQWGGRVLGNIPGFGYVQIGAYDINPNYLSTSPDIALAPTFPHGSTGVMIPVEAAWLPTFGHLAGTYKVGAWYDTSAGDDVFYNTAGQPLAVAGGTPLRDRGRYGAYVSLKQQLTADPTGVDPKHGLFFFFNATFADDRTSTTDRQIAGGLLYHGPFDWRPNDDIGVAVGTTHVNSRIAAGQAFANSLGVGPGFVQSGELATELFYGCQVTGWLNLKGGVQYIHNPGGYNNFGNFSDVFATELRVTVSF